MSSYAIASYGMYSFDGSTAAVQREVFIINDLDSSKKEQKEHAHFIERLFIERWKWFAVLDRRLTSKEYEELLVMFMAVLAVHQKLYENTERRSSKKRY